MVSFCFVLDFFALTGKGPAMVAMVKLPPCCELGPPPPCVPRGVLFFTVHLHSSFTAPPSFLSICLSTRWLPLFLSPVFVILSFSLPPLLLPSPILPSHHSGLPTGYRQGLNAALNEATFNASSQGDWARLGAPRDPASPPRIPTYVWSKVKLAPLILHCWML